MDTLRGNFGLPDANLGDGDDDERDWDSGEDETGREPPPASIGTDERRMQVRAYNHWASLLADRSFPSIEDLEPENLPDFGPYSVLLDFSTGIEDPAIQYLGGELAAECGTDVQIERLSDIPSRSLLSRITDHYLQILANQAPIGFEAEFVNQREATILYRGILLPYSSDGETIDFIYGVINWKEMADQITTDELLLEIDQALDEGTDDDVDGDEDIFELEARLEDVSRPADDPSDVPDWADGPSGDIGGNVSDMPEYSAEDEEDDDAFPIPEFGLGLSPAEQGDAEEEWPEDDDSRYAVDYGNSPEEDEDSYDDDDAVVARLSSLIQPRAGSGAGASFDEDEDDENFDAAGAVSNDVFAPRSPLLSKKPALPIPGTESVEPRISWDDEGPVDAPADNGDEISPDDDASDPYFSGIEESDTVDQPLHEEPIADGNGLADFPGDSEAQPVERPVNPDSEIEIDPDSGLYDCLAEARELAQVARSSEDRTRHALYAAVGRAYDVCLAAEEDPEEFAELVAESGLSVQERAPMTPVVKLVFGVDYDKSRIAEYSSVLAHARRLDIERGKLADFLAEADGGLKGVVQAERRLRKEEAGKETDPVDAVRPALAKKLRKLETKDFDELEAEGPEFGVLVIRRLEDGTIAVIGDVSEDIPLVEKVARTLI